MRPITVKTLSLRHPGITVPAALALALLLLSAFSLRAQDPFELEAHKEKIETFKISYLTKQLELTPEEAQQFWPVYNEYQQKLEAIRQQRRALKNPGKPFSDLTDKEVEELIDSEIEFQQQDFDIRKTYHERFKSVLSVRQVARLYHAEHEFKRLLLQHLRQKGPHGPPKGPVGPGSR